MNLRLSAKFVVWASRLPGQPQHLGQAGRPHHNYPQTRRRAEFENCKMNYPSSFLVGLVLCILSAGLMAWHVRAWKRLRHAEVDPRERDFRRRQYRRRMQTSAMLGALGAAIFIGQLLMTREISRLFLVIYWSGVLVLLLWMALLALADMAATSFYYSREKNNYIVEHAKLQGELRQAREREAKVRNGKPESGH